MRDGKPEDCESFDVETFPARLLREDVDELKKTVYCLMYELISPCIYCMAISSEAGSEKPISCSKPPGPQEAGWISLETCFTCGEYQRK